MNRMTHLLVLLVCVGQVRAEVVVGAIEFGPAPDPNLFEPEPDYMATIAETRGATAWFTFDAPDLRLVVVDLASWHNWYLVEQGDLFNDETIANGQFPNGLRAELDPPIDVGFGDFYLGVVCDRFDPDIRIHGWIEIGRTPQGLVPLGSAAAYGNTGIIVGTTDVPEPSTLILLGMGAVGLLAYRWRRKF